MYHFSHHGPAAGPYPDQPKRKIAYPLDDRKVPCGKRGGPVDGESTLTWQIASSVRNLPILANPIATLVPLEFGQAAVTSPH